MSSNYSENEIEEIANRMGQDVHNTDVLHRLKIEIDKFLNEFDAENSENHDFSYENDVANESLFASLAIDPSLGFDINPRVSKGPVCSASPIVSRRRQNGKEEYRNLVFPDSLKTPKSENSLIHEEATLLLSDAYKCIDHVYDTCRTAANVSKLRSTYSNLVSIIEDKFKKSENINVSSDEINENVELMRSISEKEDSEKNETEIADEDNDNQSSLSVPISEKNEPIKAVIVDPSIRPRRSLNPGQAPFRFDPVTRYHLYKEEWNRHPAPGELRRLSLRWKIREYMLRHDVPRLNPGSDGRIEHQKDWSPRPYLD